MCAGAGTARTGARADRTDGIGRRHPLKNVMGCTIRAALTYAMAWLAVACGGATAGTTEPRGIADSGGDEAEAALASPEASRSLDDSTSPSADVSPSADATDASPGADASLAADAEPRTEAAAGGCIGTPCSNSYDCCPGDSGGPALGIACGASGQCEACTTNGLNDPCLGGPASDAQSPDCCPGLRCVNLRCVP
jgi:hypothetical protein